MFSFFLSLFFWIIVRMPDAIYSLIDSFGFNEKVIKGMIDILIAIAAIVFSSDNPEFPGLISNYFSWLMLAKHPKPLILLNF